MLAHEIVAVARKPERVLVVRSFKHKGSSKVVNTAPDAGGVAKATVNASKGVLWPAAL